MHNRIHDLVIDLAVQCTVSGAVGTAHHVCAEFLGLASNRYGPGRAGPGRAGPGRAGPGMGIPW